MKKYLLPENGQFYKANLHCHSTVSDGALTPEEIKEHYKSHGYSIVAYTDHRLMIPHHELTDENFLAMTGYELQFNAPRPYPGGGKTCHLCFVALSPDIDKQRCWDRTKEFTDHRKAYIPLIKYDPTTPNFIPEHTPESINTAIRLEREAGFFVTYNHPTWSMEEYTDYMAYEGMNAMEICNYGSEIMGYPEYNPRVYDDMLRGGKRLYCICADDNHNHTPYGSPDHDSFGGWVCIKADKLEYRTIGEALKNGNFYASRGPEIKELWYEDGKVHIRTSPVRSIDCIFGGRRKAMRTAKADELITEAEFTVAVENATYFRLTATDEHGKTADTNAYYLQELHPEI